MTQPKYPKTVEFLRNAMLSKEGFDLALAQELTQLVNQLGITTSQNEQLKAESSRLAGALQIATDIIEAIKDEPQEDFVFPLYPQDFYVYGEADLTHSPTDDEVQELVNTAADVILEDGQYYEITDGDTIVIKLRDGDVDKIIVAQGYAEVILDDREDEVDDEEGCGNPNCPGCNPIMGFRI